jgi:hypothetical protein
MATPTVRRLVNGDMTFGRGMRNIATGAESTMQRTKCYLLGVLGEWFLDQARFIPWFQPETSEIQPIMGVPTDLRYSEGVIRAGVLAVDGIASITSFAMTRDPETRGAQVTIGFITDDGDADTIEVLFS